MNATASEPLELTPYSPMWPVAYDIERGRLAEIFGTDAVIVEHVGSTAVPGLGGKAVIDILVGAPSIEVFDRYIPALVESGYRHVEEFQRAFPQRRFLVKAQGMPGYFNMHATKYDTPFWKDLILFRDILRDDPVIRERYWRLKGLLATRFRGDRQAYSDNKTEFIQNALKTRR
jgi:GrpB-like predicted nucleotidyltransferase (UPF0157 family)